MKPAEAHHKVCPFIQNMTLLITSKDPTKEAFFESLSANDPANIKCIADSCMAWHWHVAAMDGLSIQYSDKHGYCRLIHEGEV